MSETTGARTGEQFLEGLRSDEREIWLEGEKITDPSSHPKLQGAAASLAHLFDLQHTDPDTFLMDSPDTGQPVSVTHIRPKTKDDLERRRKASKAIADASVGMMGRTPDYLNYTFACFAARADVWARYGNEQGAENLVRYANLMRDNDLSLTHTLINPQVDRSVPEADQAGGEVSLHKVEDTENGILVRGARMLATLAPFADELAVYPGSDLRLQDGKYAICFSIPMSTPGLKFVCRDSFSSQRDPWDYPLSTRFDEMDAVVIFDDVEIPRDRIFLDGDAQLHTEVITDSHWRAHIIHQAMTRAWAKLEFAFGLGHTMGDAHGRLAVRPRAGEARRDLVDDGDDPRRRDRGRGGLLPGRGLGRLGTGRALVRRAARPHAEVGAALDRAAPADRRRRLHGHPVEGGLRQRGDPARARQVLPGAQRRRPSDAREHFVSPGTSSARPSGGRGELYERFYLSDSFRMTALAYILADKEHPTELVEQFLRD